METIKNPFFSQYENSKTFTQCPIRFFSSLSPDKPALFLSDPICSSLNKKTLTYDDLNLLIDQTSEFIISKAKNKRIIGIHSKNTLTTLLILFACIRLKKVAFPLNFRLPTYNSIIKKNKIDFLFSDKEMDSSTDCDSSIFDIAQVIKNYNHVSNSFRSKSNTKDLLSNLQWVTMMQTSGTSGNPKTAVHRLENYISSSLSSTKAMNLTSSNNWLLSLPLFHVGGICILFRMFCVGGTVTLSDKNKSILSYLKSKSITHLSLIPTQLDTLLRDIKSSSDKNILDTLDCILLGGSPAPDSLIKEAFNFHLPIFPTYGLTEMTAQVTHNNILMSEKLIQIKDNEICVKGNSLFEGYWNGITCYLPLNNEDYFQTGDIGKINKSTLIIKGRLDNMFISGGENIHPEEIEDILINQPFVKQVIVVPIHSKTYGEIPVAFLDVSENKEFQLVSKLVSEYLLNNLPKFKCPTHYFKMPTLEHQFKHSRKTLKLLAEDNLK
ncbi:AMP-binding protein [bacterium]|jgi:o-succinylbenzoate---CoA ligase|nr:AMP-binding protein [bacterium]